MSLRMIWVGVLFLSAMALADPPATQPAGTLHPLHLENISPEQAFAQLGKDARATVSEPGDAAKFWERHAKPITGDIAALPYWEALHELCVLANVSARGSTEQSIVLEEPTPAEGRQFAIVHGLVQVELDSMRSQQRLELTTHAVATSTCRLSFRARAPGGLHALRSEPIRIDAMTDQDGKPIPVKNRFPGIWPSNGQLLTEIMLDRAPTVRKISRIAGELAIILRGPIQTLEADCTGGRVEKDMAGLHFNIMPRYAKNVCDVEINVSSEGDAGAVQEFSRNVQATWPQLLDARGEKYQMASISSRGGTDFHATLHYRPPIDAKIGVPQKLVWQFSTTGRTITIPFEFKNVPLEQE